MTPAELQEVLHQLDHAKPAEEVQLIVSRAFNIPLEGVGSQLRLEGAEQLGMATPTSKVIQRLDRIGTCRSGPRS